LRCIERYRYRLQERIVSAFEKRVEIRECDDARSLTAQAVAFHNGMLSRGTELDRFRVVARLYRKSRTRDVTSLAKMVARKCELRKLSPVADCETKSGEQSSRDIELFVAMTN